MSLKIPQNKIQFKYTIGKEYIYADSYKEYQGHYYEINNSFFAGKEFKINAPVLIKKNSSNINLLKSNPKTAEYANISGINLKSTKITSIISTGKDSVRYFIKKINNNPILIKEINEETFNQFIKNPLYQLISLQFNSQTGFNDREVEEANKIMIGIKEFLKDLNFNPISDEDSYSIGQG